MISLLKRYTHWLHTRWPAGLVEKLPEAREDGSTAVPGLYIVGDLTGIPLLKFSADTGARAVQTIVADSSFQSRDTEKTVDDRPVLDLAIVGAGVSGMAAALQARSNDLTFELLEAAEPFSTIVNFPRAKPIFTYPTNMTPAGELQFSDEADVKESLLAELDARTLGQGIEVRTARVESVSRSSGVLRLNIPGEDPVLAHRVIVGIGRSGNYRKLGVPGETLDKVYNRLHDPKDFCDRNVLVVGGGDSALETAIAIAECGGHVTLSYRKPEFARPKPDNVDKLTSLKQDPQALTLLMQSQVQEIGEADVSLKDAEGKAQTLPNDAVFTMIGREPPLGFFRRSGVPVLGEWRLQTWIGFLLFVLFGVFVYHWKGDYAEIPLNRLFREHGWFPFNVPTLLSTLGAWFNDSTSLGYTLKTSMADPSFYYTVMYCLCVVIFGVRRIRRRRTQYIKWQTITLMLIQCIPLFILPQILLPWLGRNGVFESGTSLGWIADQLFEAYDGVGLERAWWRAYGLILAWPLFVHNWFTGTPLWGWVVVGFVQTFVLIPWMIHRWGKGAYCGWICSCGALAETLGDGFRHKMPHGPKFNRLNMIGQVFLWAAALILLLRIGSWVFPGGALDTAYQYAFKKLPVLNYAYIVDLWWAGVIGVACYFWFSGRVWCRFACPLAALMHVYARFSRFRILADKRKCISCNVCTSVCHQGIDIMSFANKGQGMEDPQCVRCSACVQSCPTGVLTFGQVDRKTGKVLSTDRLAASPVQMAEQRGDL